MILLKGCIFLIIGIFSLILLYVNSKKNGFLTDDIFSQEFRVNLSLLALGIGLVILGIAIITD